MEKEKSENYNPKEAEPRLQKFWEKEKIYAFDAKSEKPVYSIDTPPPYASSGHLHVGHGLSYTQFEIIARIMRQMGYNVYFAPCFDNNGLPTEKYVEEKYNIDKSKTTRAEFRKLCLEESSKVEKLYADQVFKVLGHSYDWNLLYTTIAPESQKVSQTSFVELYKKGDCYRAEQPVIWCCYHQTALAQAEVEDKTRETKLNYILFDLEKEKIEIATTRPELLSSCVGIFVHPEDKRYKKLIGKKAKVPLFNYEVLIMADEKVDPEFGTGIVMVCTFGDKTDIEWWQKHKLPLKISITQEGKLNENAGKYSGMTLKEAREAIIKDLEKEKRLVKQEKLTQTVGACWRCGNAVEFIVAKQWFIKTLKYKKELIEYGKKVNWHPDFMFVRYKDWVTNLGWDWCISRQRFYGVPIPVWYCKKCKKEIVAEKEDLPIDPMQTKPKKKCSCGSNEFIPEEDVFDTWMTSSNSPEIALRWLDKPEQYKKLAPMSLRPQSHDIIRTWAFYTILKSFLLFKRIPWKDIIINTYVLDEKGRGMHKSLGNVVWADEMIEKYNVDAFRYWVATASLGADLPFQEKDIVAGNKLINKIWNAAKFSMPNALNKKPKEFEAFDLWLLVKLNKLIKEVTEHFKKYDISKGNTAVEQFFWHTFCDNYLEIIKDRIYNNKKGKDSAQYVLYHSFLAILKLIAPIMSHITEELYQIYFKKQEKVKSIHISGWPKFDEKMINEKIEKMGDEFIEIITKVRQAKSKAQKSMKAPIILTIDKKHEKQENHLFLQDLKSVTAAQEIKFGEFDIKFV